MSVLTQFFPAGGSGGGIPVELMVISGGGGGGGGSLAAGPGLGGGSGAMFYCRSFPLQPGVTYPVTVGSGGAKGICYTSAGSNGGNSCFTIPVDGGNNSICVAGGGGGSGGICTPTPECGYGLNGGTGGGSACSVTLSYYQTHKILPQDINSGGYFGTSRGPTTVQAGGIYCCSLSFIVDPSYCTFVCGSFFTNIYGSEVCLGGGGSCTEAGQPLRVQLDMPANCGYGGGGGAGCNSSNPSCPGCPGGNGSSGVVVVKYPSAYGAAPASPGATNCSPATPGFYTYRFTSPGSITLP